MIILNNNLRLFITVAETGNLTEAAKKLYISQPAVSQAVKKLEEELGVKLFIRNKRSSLTLTAAGKDILALAYRMADLENKIYQRAYEENHLLGGAIKIASVPIGVSLILSRVLPVFKKRFPYVTVELLEGTPAEVKNLLLGSQADLGITTSPYMDLQHETLMKDRMVSIHRDEARAIDLRKDTSDLVLCRVAYDSLMEQFSGERIDLSHALVLDAASTQINVIENGTGEGVISELMLSTIPNGLVRGKVYPEKEIEISLTAINFDALTPAAKEMKNMILERKLIS